jgi:hypothetical protein
MKLIQKGAYYAGIGSRETPDDILALMRKIAYKLAKLGMVLRSGGADGADTAFQEGCIEADGKMEIYIPWNGFNNYSNGHKGAILVTDPKVILGAEDKVRRYHPAPKSLTIGGRKLMMRNAYQVLGGNLNKPSAFVLCWTKDRADGLTIPTSQATGGTGQAIRIANEYGIFIRNLANPESRKKWEIWLETDKAT